MLKATQGKELVIRTQNQIGALKTVSKTVAEKGVSILAISCWVYDIMAIIRIMTDDNLRAKEALEAAKFDVDEENIVVSETPHKSGLLKHITEQLEEAKIDLKHLYATARENDEKCLVVFSSSDNEKALVVLNKIKDTQKVTS